MVRIILSEEDDDDQVLPLKAPTAPKDGAQTGEKPVPEKSPETVQNTFPVPEKAEEPVVRAVDTKEITTDAVPEKEARPDQPSTVKISLTKSNPTSMDGTFKFLMVQYHSFIWKRSFSDT